MSSSSKNDSAKPALTQKQVELLTTIMKNLKTQPEIDWDAVAGQGGFASKASAKEVYRQMRLKLGWPTILGAGNPSASSSGAAVAGGPKTPTKVNRRNPQAHRAALKASMRKRAAFEARKAAHEGGDDGDDDEGKYQQEEEEGGAEVEPEDA